MQVSILQQEDDPMATKFIAHYNGKIVGTRTSQNRIYTHAVVGQLDEAYARDKAYNHQALHSNFDYHLDIANSAPDRFRSQQSIDRAIAIVAGGWEAYQTTEREQWIKLFEDRKAKGDFEPSVWSWAGSLALANKAARGWDSPARKLLAVVPAEIVEPRK
jgi:hypothetical protein